MAHSVEYEGKLLYKQIAESADEIRVLSESIKKKIETLGVLRRLEHGPHDDK